MPTTTSRHHRFAQWLRGKQPATITRRKLDVTRLEERAVPASYTVNTLSDANTGSGLSGSLRYCIAQSNLTGVVDDIGFSITGTISVNGEMAITNPLNINGPGSTNLILNSVAAASATSRIFNVGATTVNISGMKISGGNVSGNGGGIINSGTTTLTALTISGNSATAFSGGGGIFNSGTLTLNNSTLSGNSATSGGAITSSTSLAVSNSTLSGNSATGGNQFGGAIYMPSTNGSATISTSTFSGNKAGSRGGGIAMRNGTLSVTGSTFSGNGANEGAGLYNGFGGLTVSNSTLSGNSAGLGGGGIQNFSTLNLRNSTLTNNSAGRGGGLDHAIGSATVTSTIASGNAGSTGPDFSSNNVVNLSFSAIGITSGFSFSGSNNIFGQNLLLGPLINNGGPTLTHGPCTGSPLIDAGSNPASLTTDQRGAGFPRQLGSAVDIGAFEGVTILPCAMMKALGPIVTAGATPNTVDVIYTDDTGIDVFTIGKTDITILDPNSNAVTIQSATFSPAGNGTPRTATYTFSLPGGTWDQADNGTYTVNLKANEVIDINANAVSAGTLGKFQVSIVTPTAAMTSLGPIVFAGVTPNTIDVVYTDDTGVNVATIGTSDVTILDPSGNAVTIQSVTVSPGGNGTPRTATYTFSIPGGIWDATDNGSYAVKLNANEVLDINANPVAAGTLGTFSVNITGKYLVDEVSDVFDGVLSKGKLSLREAIDQANTDGTASTITFDATVFATAKTITLSLGEYLISNSVDIVGPSAGVIINAAEASRALNSSISGAGNVQISRLTFDAGNTTTNGGAISFGDDNLSLTNCSVTNSKALSFGGNGGGIAGTGGSLTLDSCTIAGNSAQSSGGGIFMIGSAAKIAITNSTISGNICPNGYMGGGIYGRFMNSVTITNSTISGNENGDRGGGIGLRDFSNGASLLIQNSTITDNKLTTSSIGGGIGMSGGGSVTLHSTIVAMNSATTGPDIRHDTGLDLAGNHNLIGNADGTNFNLTGSSNLTGTTGSPISPLLAPLASNGGPTQTHALLAGSPAIGAGNNSAMLSNDQRGAGFARVSGGAADIGAFEIQVVAPPTITSVIINGSAIQRSMATSLKITFSEPITLPPNPADAFQISRIQAVGFEQLGITGLVNISAMQSGNDITITFNSTGGNAVNGVNGSLADGHYELKVLANQITGLGGQLDGNGDGVSGDDFIRSRETTPAMPFFRLFGDSNGDAKMDATDYIQFRLALGGTDMRFDYDNDGDVDVMDFRQFRLRFGGAI